MPIYEYHCVACDHDFEEIVGVNEPTPGCPRCAQDVIRKISLTSFRLKGEGWYADAYAGKSNKAPLTKSKPKNDD